MSERTTYYLLILELGVTVMDKDRQILYFREFQDPILSNTNFKNKKFQEILEQDLKFFKNNPGMIYTNYADIVDLLKTEGYKVERISQLFAREIQINKIDIYLDGFNLGLDKNKSLKSDIVKGLRDFSLKWSSLKIQEASEQLDLHISQSINALDELDKILNTVGTRMREWYGLHFPELDNLLQNITTYANIVLNAGKRDDITKDFLSSIEIPENKIEIILEAARRSKGGKITDENLHIVQNLAQQVLSMSKIRKTLEDHLDISMEDVAPNTKELLTASVGARLIAKAGSLKKLASISSSTIQILGAEKALFRTLKTGANPPKHGILFQHPVIHSAPKWQRGKLARAISSKAAIAARLDLYGRNPEKNTILTDKLNDRIAEIQEKYKEPSVIQQKHQTHKQEQFARPQRDRYSFNRGSKGRGFGRDGGRGGDRGDFKSKKSKFKKRHHKSNKE